jgi:hypothetical protein
MKLAHLLNEHSPSQIKTAQNMYIDHLKKQILMGKVTIPEWVRDLAYNVSYEIGDHVPVTIRFSQAALKNFTGVRVSYLQELLVIYYPSRKQASAIFTLTDESIDFDKIKYSLEKLFDFKIPSAYLPEKNRIQKYTFNVYFILPELFDAIKKSFGILNVFLNDEENVYWLSSVRRNKKTLPENFNKHSLVEHSKDQIDKASWKYRDFLVSKIKNHELKIPDWCKLGWENSHIDKKFVKLYLFKSRDYFSESMVSSHFRGIQITINQKLKNVQIEAGNDYYEDGWPQPYDDVKTILKILFDYNGEITQKSNAFFYSEELYDFLINQLGKLNFLFTPQFVHALLYEQYEDLNQQIIKEHSVDQLQKAQAMHALHLLKTGKASIPEWCKLGWEKNVIDNDLLYLSLYKNYLYFMRENNVGQNITQVEIEIKPKEKLVNIQVEWNDLQVNINKPWVVKSIAHYLFGENDCKIIKDKFGKYRSSELYDFLMNQLGQLKFLLTPQFVDVLINEQNDQQAIKEHSVDQLQKAKMMHALHLIKTGKVRIPEWCKLLKKDWNNRFYIDLTKPYDQPRMILEFFIDIVVVSYSDKFTWVETLNSMLERLSINGPIRVEKYAVGENLKFKSYELYDKMMQSLGPLKILLTPESFEYLNGIKSIPGILNEHKPEQLLVAKDAVVASLIDRVNQGKLPIPSWTSLKWEPNILGITWRTTQGPVADIRIKYNAVKKGVSIAFDRLTSVREAKKLLSNLFNISESEITFDGINDNANIYEASSTELYEKIRRQLGPLKILLTHKYINCLLEPKTCTLGKS